MPYRFEHKCARCKKRRSVRLRHHRPLCAKCIAAEEREERAYAKCQWRREAEENAK